MLFKLFAILTLATAAHVLAAHLAEKADDDLTVIQSWPHGNGTLVAYGSARSAVTVRSKRQAPCSSTITCDLPPPPNLRLCSDLIYFIQNSTDVLPTAPFSALTFCFSGEGNMCCVSWSIGLGDLKYSDLFDPAEAIFQECAGHGSLGRVKNYSINGQCATVCLSKGPVFNCS